MKGIAPIIAEVIIVAMAIAVALTVALYFSGVTGTFMHPTLVSSHTVVVTSTPLTGRERLEDKPTLSCCYTGGKYMVREEYPLSYVKVVVLVGPIDNDPTTHLCVYLNVTALKKLDFIRVHATFLAKDGQPPDWVGGATVEWQDNDVPRSWFASRYWCPVREDELPGKIYISIEVPGP
ncbi:MAG: hypothetical protein DRJ35_07600 [Thermoprotei archaeon]|nr:MAG: hypothetical protein DRJ35_07600 [Thermoprotei archaeon]